MERKKTLFLISRSDIAPAYNGTNKKFEYSAYASVNKNYLTEDALTVYKNVGMTILLPQNAASVSVASIRNGTPMTTSSAELNNLISLMDKAAKAGLKVAVTDYRLILLCREISDGGVIGSGNFTNTDIKSGIIERKFQNEQALDNYVSKCLAGYKDHEAFYGVLLQDEPDYKMATAYGQVYKSIKRVCSDAYVQMNLYPMERTAFRFYPPLAGKENVDETNRKATDVSNSELYTRYTSYVTSFLDATDCDYLQYDQYPMTNSKGIIEEYIKGFQLAADLCADRGIILKHVAQTCAWYSNGTLNRRELSEADARFINNVMLGFGVKDMVYYTFWEKDSTTEETVVSGSTFVDSNGNPTDLYDFMKKIIAENNAFANVILNFDYRSSKIVTGTTVSYPSQQVNLATSGSLTKVTSVTSNKEYALVTELYDEVKGNYMYMLQNITNPINGTVKQTSTITFSAEYSYAAVFINGVRSDIELNNGSYTATLNAGDAVYIIPY